jgi:hypothetical protein
MIMKSSCTAASQALSAQVAGLESPSQCRPAFPSMQKEFCAPALDWALCPQDEEEVHLIGKSCATLPAEGHPGPGPA